MCRIHITYKLRKIVCCKVLVSSGLGEPNSLAVDYYNYEVCWADGGRKELNLKPKIGQLTAKNMFVHLLF